MNNIPYYLECYNDLVTVKSYTIDDYGVIRASYIEKGVNKYQVVGTRCFHISKEKINILLNTEKDIEYKGVKFRIPSLYNKNMILPLCLKENSCKDNIENSTFNNRKVDIKEGLFIDVKSKAIYEVFDFYKNKPVTEEY